LRCLTGQGQCSVAHEIRRKCPKCRLERCFAAGMRKDFILSEEDKQRRKKHLEENRNRTSQHLSTSELTNSLSITHSASKFEPISPTSDEIDRVSFSLSPYLFVIFDVNKVILSFFLVMDGCGQI